MTQTLRILLAGGGTGGHIYGGIALAEALQEMRPEAQVLFVGTSFGLEKDIVPQKGWELKTLKVKPLKGSKLSARLKSLFNLPQALFQAFKIVKKFKPHLVIGIGGYASAPTIIAARLQKIFTAIIEQNAYPGLTNRKLAPWVNRIFVAFEKALKFFDPKKTFVTGNPVRSFKRKQIDKEKNPFTIFILGGSQGASSLNEAMIASLDLLKDFQGSLHFIHQTGKKDYERVKAAYEKAGFSHEVYDFIQEVGPSYEKTNLAIARAGAGTITELRLYGIPAILVPYPYAADDHQRLNALDMTEHGAAEMVLNQNLSPELLAEKIKYYLSSPSALEQMGLMALKQAKPMAAKKILEYCLLSSELSKLL
ncbi:MAG: undecaprenyldiphospho-muramoylpentapeptide beta-N-acetylglucosaminyltransferase [Deltaproteobacteria bacterium]|nr:undecaprenyldiphospho-muramoylpentapeptide beta-N-acetylglucosaminyltransferase [Deltaproteobacteria bacterium]